MQPGMANLAIVVAHADIQKALTMVIHVKASTGARARAKEGTRARAKEVIRAREEPKGGEASLASTELIVRTGNVRTEVTALADTEGIAEINIAVNMIIHLERAKEAKETHRRHQNQHHHGARAKERVKDAEEKVKGAEERETTLIIGPKPAHTARTMWT